MSTSPAPRTSSSSDSVLSLWSHDSVLSIGSGRRAGEERVRIRSGGAGRGPGLDRGRQRPNVPFGRRQPGVGEP
ncbi:hypothetical protein AB0D87_21230 [Streptomyces sp. NPDC048342]|uniref:hypothetical protein n=1 Tax=Streptomyces TaxID=1883 RepID=UPI001F20D750|nr:hypothetical protein [Streptomyces shenzhenensis]